MSFKTDLAQFTGTEEYYRHNTGLLYTDGIQFLAETYGAYWLIDAIASYQPGIKEEALKEFQLWTMERNGNQGRLYMQEDSDRPKLIEQRMSFTDFPETQKFYVCGGTLLLPSEY